MTRTYLDTSSPQSEFSGSLRSALRLRGSLVVDSREDADSVLLVSEDDTGQRVLSVSARNTPREYEIYYAVTIAVEAGSQQLMGPESLVVTRSYTYDETQVLGKSAEERVLRRSLADDLARQVLRRIESISEQSNAPNT
jgi:LPS-assembly lipoprotein